jgi:hypothetical protein
LLGLPGDLGRLGGLGLGLLGELLRGHVEMLEEEKGELELGNSSKVQSAYI